MTTITALPTPPSRDDPANFSSRADAFLGALPDFVTEANTVAGEVNSNASTASTAASTATTQAGIATTQASAASASATTAAGHVTTASGHASAAAASAAAAAASYDSFDDRYLGAKASDPSTDNDGNALVTGALYWNTASNILRAWSGSAWVNSFVAAGTEVTGPASATDGHIALFNGATGKAIKSAGVALSSKQDALVSGTNIKTVNSTSLLGSGNITTGDVTGQASSVDNEIALFSSTTGKVIKRATTTGILKASSGVIGAAVSGTDIKTINGSSILGSGDLAVGGGSWIYLSTVTASGSSTVDIETTINSTYDQYVITASDIYWGGGNTDSILSCQLKIDGAYKTDAYYGVNLDYSSGAGAYANTVSGAASAARILYSTSAADRLGAFQMVLFQPSNTTRRKAFTSKGYIIYNAASSTPIRMDAVGYYSNSTGAITGVRFLPATGTLYGTFRLYGIKNS